LDELVTLGADDFLLDSFSTTEYGGTGQAFDWDLASELSSQDGNIYLAGGLNPENVADAVRMVRPYAVDVASGVESSPGKKDANKLEAFIRNAKNA
jgi:phosphoribosylanthranilate isomerase